MLVLAIISIRQWSWFTFQGTLPMSENGGKACIRQKSWFFVSNVIANFLFWFKLSPGCWYLPPPSYLPFPVFIKFDRAVGLSLQVWTNIASFFYIVNDIIAVRLPFFHRPCSPVAWLWQLVPQFWCIWCYSYLRLGGGRGGESGEKLKISRCTLQKSSFYHNCSFLASTEVMTFCLKELRQINLWIYWNWNWW